MPEDFYYEGFSSPNGTIVPDDVFDLLAPRLSEAELRVLLYIIRRTFGFKKGSDDISLKQMVDGIKTREGKVLDRGTGLSKSAAARGVKGLVAKGIVVSKRNRSQEKGDEPTNYTLHFRRDPVFSKETGGVPLGEHPRVFFEDTQQTVLQQTVRQEYSRKKESLVPSISNEEGGVGGDSDSDHPVENSGPANISLVPSGDPQPQRQLPLDPTPRAQAAAEPRSGSRRGLTAVGQAMTENPSVSAYFSGPQGRSEARRTAPNSAAVVEDSPPESGPTEAPKTQEIKRGRGRPKKVRTPFLDETIADWSAEFHDEEHIPSNIVQARNLLKASGMDEVSFVENVLYPARSITKQQGGIQKPAEGYEGVRNKAPYFFEVVRDRLGLRVDEAGPKPPIQRGGRKLEEEADYA